MTNITKLRVKTISFSIIIALLLGCVFYSAAQCITCNDAEYKAEIEKRMAQPESELLKNSYEQWVSNMHNPAFDHPEDSTTERAKKLDSYFITPWVPAHPIRFSSIEKELVNLALHDPYIEVRLGALSTLFQNRKTFSLNVVLNTLKKAFDDPCLPIQFTAARFILNLNINDSTVALDPHAKKIIFETATGKNRSNWNVKGLYSKEQLAQDSLIVETIRSSYQTAALTSLGALEIHNPYIFNDTVDWTPKIRDFRKEIYHRTGVQNKEKH